MLRHHEIAFQSLLPKLRGIAGGEALNMTDMDAPTGRGISIGHDTESKDNASVTGLAGRQPDSSVHGVGATHFDTHGSCNMRTA